VDVVVPVAVGDLGVTVRVAGVDRDDVLVDGEETVRPGAVLLLAATPSGRSCTRRTGARAQGAVAATEAPSRVTRPGRRWHREAWPGGR